MISQPLNIVFFPHSANYGLAGTNRLQNIIYFLKKEERNISVSNIALEDRSKLLSKENTEPFISDYKEIYYSPSIGLFIKHIFQTGWYLLKFKKRACKNVIYFYGEVDIKNFFFVFWARLIGYRVVIDIVEDLDTIVKFKSFKNKVKYKSAIFFRRHLNWFADGFTAVSGHLERKVQNYFPSLPVFFLPVTVNKYLLAERTLKKEEGLLTIFYSGSFNEKDGLSYLLNGLSSVKNAQVKFRFVLSGKGSEPEMKKFAEDVEKAGLTAEVVLLGFLSRQEYIQVLTSQADILCMTRVNSSFSNAGFPFKLGEFLATGKPVIASRVGDIEKYLRHTDAFLVDPEDPDQIMQAVLDIFKDKAKAKKTGENGKAAAMKYFDHESYDPGLYEFINNLIS